MQKRKIRGSDSQGSGHYLASRGNRKHMGIDFITCPEDLISSYCSGIVTKIGYPYNPNKHPHKAHLRYVEVTDSNQLKVRVFYIQPLVAVGDIIELDTVIGTSQDLTQIYEGITQHLHFEVKKGKHFENPMNYLGLHDKDLE
jgi:murein DD-endopeptidase MepM/ murein hydrolase activator NlpD